MEDGLLPAIRECLGDLAESLSEHVAPIKFVGDAVKIAWSVPDRILFRKIEAFLVAVPQEKRDEFARKTANDPALKKKIGEHLVLTLDQMDDFEKAEIHAKIFCSYVADKISIETLRRLASSVNAAFIVDLKHISDSPQSILQEYLGNLLRSGLSRPSGQLRMDHEPIVEMNHLGRIFQQVMRDEPITG